MDETEVNNLDIEFRRYLQLLRPYLGQLLDQDVITICDAWINRLSNCKNDENSLRNKYLFLLCYQLAKGILEGPFLNYPPDVLVPLNEDFNSDDSLHDLDCEITESGKVKTQVLFNSKNITRSDAEYLSHDDGKNCNSEFESEKISNKDSEKAVHQQNLLCYIYPEMVGGFNAMPSEEYECRANNLIKKLREIKNQNMFLQKELVALKEESTVKPENFIDDSIMKVDTATSAYLRSNDSTSTMKSLKFKLQEVQNSRNILIETISNLQEKIDTFNEMKNNEIEEIKANYKLEVIKLKTAIREETKDCYEKKYEELKLNYEGAIREIQNKTSNEVKEMATNKDAIIDEKNKLLTTKDAEIARLKIEVEEHKKNLHSVLNNFVDKPAKDESDNTKIKVQQMQKLINKMEKSKMKCVKQYEAKVAQLQREKHLAECSLQLQLVKQRAQVISELTDENQTELSTSLEKLENKYKEIVANVQATAIQKRMQDQVALESILQVACGNDFQGQYITRNIRNQNQSYNAEISSLMRGNKAGNVVVGNKSFGEDSFVSGYCLNSERMGELFERVYIPQRDNGEAK